MKVGDTNEFKIKFSKFFPGENIAGFPFVELGGLVGLRRLS